MTSSNLLTFEQAIEDDGDKVENRSVLLGNGFSIDWCPEVFNYGSLYQEADLDGVSVGKEELFGMLETQDFEKVVEYLNSSADLSELYDEGSEEFAKQLRRDANVVRHGLAQVLAKRHPHRADEVSDEEVAMAQRFLANFSKIFTVNYDLLLYWVLNRREVRRKDLPRTDGFGLAGGDDRRLIWSPPGSLEGQRVFNLHGSLHLFIEDGRVRKIKSERSTPIIRQVRERILEGQYPFVVTEGRNTEKAARVDASPYLRFARDSFKDDGGSLFVHGMSLSENDDHLIEMLESEDSLVRKLYVGVHGDANRRSAKSVMERAKEIADRREENGGSKLIVRYYDSGSANVWRKP